jgi:hypothetical protein
MKENTRNPLIIKLTIGIGIQLVIALIHIFRLGQIFNGRLYQIYYSYFSDFILPFGMYFLLCINQDKIKFLKKWTIKFILVFSVTSAAEIMQAFGIPALGITFDPLDFVMYGLGAITAVGVEKLLLERYISSWNGGS